MLSTVVYLVAGMALSASKVDVQMQSSAKNRLPVRRVAARASCAGGAEPRWRPAGLIPDKSFECGACGGSVEGCPFCRGPALATSWFTA